MSKAKDDSFFQRVFDVCKQIPYGRITTYGAIARYLSSAGASRMVGWAMNSSHNCGFYVPAHRVLNRKGLLTGKHHFGSPTLMQQLLEQEGIAIENDKVVDFNRFFWDPSIELNL